MSSLGKSLDTSREKVRYDMHAKRVLSDRWILAWILKGLVREFSDCTIEEIRNQYIGDKVQISEIPVEPGVTNSEADRKPERITGENTEDAVPDEGTIYFDIRFHVWVPQKYRKGTKRKKLQQVKILMNIEAQNKLRPGYSIITRGIFYAARMISAQLDTEFTAKDYDGMKKVYSIWLCPDAPKKMRNAISEYHIIKTDVLEGMPDEPDTYDKLSVIVAALNDEVPDSGGTEAYDRMSRLLKVVLSNHRSVEEKKRILQSEYHISVDKKTEGEMRSMCNLSDLIEARGIQKGIAEGEMRRLISQCVKKLCKGYLEERIADELETDLLTVSRIVAAAGECGSGYDEDRIYERFVEMNEAVSVVGKN